MSYVFWLPNVNLMVRVAHICIYCHKHEHDHVCKTNITNPTYGNLYIKNWILTKGFTPIYNKCKEQEVVNIHYEECWRRICSCPELKPHISDRIPVNENDVLHCF